MTDSMSLQLRREVGHHDDFVGCRRFLRDEKSPARQNFIGRGDGHRPDDSGRAGGDRVLGSDIDGQEILSPSIKERSPVAGPARRALLPAPRQ